MKSSFFYKDKKVTSRISDKMAEEAAKKEQKRKIGKLGKQ